MTLPDLVAQYGYFAVFGGALLEGETVLLLGGAAAQRGYLSFPVVVVVAFCAGTLGDQILFGIGRRYGSALLRRYPKFQPGAERTARLIERHQHSIVIGVRFMYGLRLIGPIAIGMSQIPRKRLLVLNMIGAAIWAPLIVGIGYFFGHALDRVLAGLGDFELIGLGVVIVIAAAIFLFRRHRRQRGDASTDEPET